MTPADYAAGAQAALKVINTDLDKDIPHQVFFGFDVHDLAAQQFTPQMRQKLALEISKAVIDAVEAERANNANS